MPLVITFSSVDKDVYRQFAAEIRTVAETQTKMIASVDLRSLPSPWTTICRTASFCSLKRPMYMP